MKLCPGERPSHLHLTVQAAELTRDEVLPLDRRDEKQKHAECEMGIHPFNPLDAMLSIK